MRRIALLVAVLASLTATAVAHAAPPTLPDVEDEVMCPTCRTPLNVAEARLDEELRAFDR